MCDRGRIIEFSQNDHVCPKTAFSKAFTKTYYLSDLRKIDNERCINSLQSLLFGPHTDYSIHNPEVFFQIPQNFLDNHASKKKKRILRNHKPFMNKRL